MLLFALRIRIEQGWSSGQWVIEDATAYVINLMHKLWIQGVLRWPICAGFTINQQQYLVRVHGQVEVVERGDNRSPLISQLSQHGGKASLVLEIEVIGRFIQN